MAYKKGLSFALGAMTLVASIDSVVPSAKSERKRLCAKHHLPVKQGYKCHPLKGDAHELAYGEWIMGIPDGESWALVPDGEKFAPDSHIELSVVPAEELDESTFMEGSIYYITPDNQAGNPFWEVLRRFAEDKNVALVSKATFRASSYRKLWRLTTFRGHLVMRELKFPDAVREAPQMPVIKLSKAELDMFKKVRDALVTPFTDVDVSDDKKEQLEELIASAERVPYQDHLRNPKLASGKPAPVLSLMDALTKSIEATKKKKAS